MPDAEAMEPNVEPTEGPEPEEQGAVEPEQTGETEERAPEPEAKDDPAVGIQELRQENKRLRRSRSEQHNQIQRLVDERAEAVRERDEAARRAEDAEVEVIRYRVAAEKEIPIKSAHRLHGSTYDEMMADAEEFLQEHHLSPPTPTTRGFDGGARQTMPAPMSPEQAHNDMLLRSLGRKR